MQLIETMSVSEIDAKLARLRARRQVLKSSGSATQRQIATLARRRERLLRQVNILDEQIAQLRPGQSANQHSAPAQPRTRRRQSQVTACLDAILACVERHTVTQRATIVEECHLSPVNASAYLRQLCQDGKLIRHGNKRATTYALPS